MLLAVLASSAQLAVYEIALPAHIGHHRVVPTTSLVGTGNAFLLCLRVVARGTSMSTGPKPQGSLDSEAWFFTSSCVFSHKRALRMERPISSILWRRLSGDGILLIPIA